MELDFVALLTLFVGLISYQIKLVNDKVKDEIKSSNITHLHLQRDVHCLKNKFLGITNCICDLCKPCKCEECK